MGLRDRFLKLLDRGEPPQVDPNAMVELVSVPLPRGPMLVAQLREVGFDVQGLEAYDIPSHGVNRYRIMVRQRDYTAAFEALERYQ